MDTKLGSGNALKALAVAVGLTLGSAAFAQDEQRGVDPSASQSQQSQQSQQSEQDRDGGIFGGDSEAQEDRDGGIFGGRDSSDAQSESQDARSAEAQSGSQQSQDLQQLAEDHGDISQFVEALEQTGLASTVTQEGQQYTAFAPTDDAFDELGDRGEELMKPENRAELTELLRNHLVVGEVDEERAKTLTEALAVTGETLRIESSEDGEIMINGATVDETNLQAGTLTIHTIDQVLEPSGLAGSSQRSGQSDQRSDQGSQAESPFGRDSEGSSANPADRANPANDQAGGEGLGAADQARE